MKRALSNSEATWPGKRHLGWVVALAISVFSLAGLDSARALIFYDTADPNYNTTAPTGIYQDSGWGYIGEYGAFLGTMIGSQYFITAQHIGIQGSTFTGKADSAVYTIDSTANGGQGYWDIPGTDLRILKINESFSSWAPLYTGNAEANKTMVLFGRSGPRGAEIPNKGWYEGVYDGVTRWGVNEVEGVAGSAAGPMLVATFDSLFGQFEATLSPGDSGGAVFILDGGVWKLAGVNYGIPLFDTNNVKNDGSEFLAALYDSGGYFTGSDDSSWTYIPDQPQDIGSALYASRISSNAAAINAIVTAPEPAGAILLGLSGLWCLRRRRAGSA